MLVAANNQLESARALGDLGKGSNLRHLDLSHNLISIMEAPRSPRSFRHLKELRLASNCLESFEEDAAVSLPSLERVDVSGSERMRRYQFVYTEEEFTLTPFTT